MKVMYSCVTDWLAHELRRSVSRPTVARESASPRRAGDDLAYDSRVRTSATSAAARTGAKEPVQTTTSAPVCVTGMHRSGTSLVARLLHECGFHLGREDELLAPNPANVEGY